ncbi:MAG TPA: ACT domain-containing protein [Anaerolineae bacterium]|nr:ACT domain-containing protein [Anaerolineae bacterium]
MGRVKIGGILQQKDLALVGMMAVPDRPGIAAAVFKTLGKRGINVIFIAQLVDLDNNTHVEFCVASKDASVALGLLRPLKERFGGRGITHRARVAMVSIFGPDFRETPGVAGMMHTALADAGINILSISTSISSVNCVIDEERLDDAVAALKDAFEFS